MNKEEIRSKLNEKMSLLEKDTTLRKWDYLVLWQGENKKGKAILTYWWNFRHQSVFLIL